METFRSLTIILLLMGVLLLPLVRCDDKDNLLQGINSFRQSSRLTTLMKQDKAGCVADEIANKLEHTPCSASNTTQSQVASNYPDVLKKCEVDPNSTRDGMILPVCVPGSVETLVLTNYTQSQNAKYLNSSKFTGAGIGTEDDWTVLILTTSTPGGSYVSRVSRIAVTIGSGQYVVVSVFLVMFLGSL